jgi:RNA polymerase sigma-70 factor (ECF subfamily)
MPLSPHLWCIMAALHSSPSTASSLVNLARQNDSQAWFRLMTIYQPLVHGWCLAAQLQPSDAADVSQEVFQAVANHIKKFDRARTGSFRAWLKKIFRSKLINFFRTQATLPVSVDGQHLEEFVARLVTEFDSADNIQRERKQLLQQILRVIRQDFNEKTWEAFWLSVVVNQRTSVIAQELHMSSAAICSARARVLRRLRETLEGLEILEG